MEGLTREIDSIQSLFPQMRESVAIPRKIDVDGGKARVVVGKINEVYTYSISKRQPLLTSVQPTKIKRRSLTRAAWYLYYSHLFPRECKTADKDHLCRPRPRKRNDIRSAARAGLFPIFHLMVIFFLPLPIKGREHGI